jgi:CRP-like cAMP-binding protein
LGSHVVMVDSETLTRNRLLATLPPEELAALEQEFELVSFDLKEFVYREDQPIEHVVFPTSGVLSLISQMADGRGVEVATIGNEGMVGLPVFLQATATSAHRAFAQIPGEALRIPADRFSAFIASAQDGALHRILHRYTQALMSMIARAVACNALHSVEQRASRWLLITHDRINGDEFLLTQEFLGQMLGVTRPTVNETARQLQDAGAIDYTRGHITVLSRPELEARSCECYAVIRNEFDRLLSDAA